MRTVLRSRTELLKANNSRSVSEPSAPAGRLKLVEDKPSAAADDSDKDANFS
jgi:hypothetical protein